MKNDWKIVSYSNDKLKFPKVFKLKCGNINIKLVWDHYRVKNTWSTSLYGLYDNHDLKLEKYEDLEIAKTKAKEFAISKLKEILKDLEN